ncbi:MAG: trimethylamine methyltransferase family protein [Candidatus Methanomethylicia archaeon]
MSTPKIQLLSKEEIEYIHYSSIEILEEVGVKIYNDNALKLLYDNGCEVDFNRKIVRIPQSLVKEALSKTPSTIKLYGRSRSYDRIIGGDIVTFNPGSAALYILDYDRNEIRKPTSNDLVNLVRLADALENIHAQSTALVVSDVPESIVDRYRLYIVLKNSPKPIITGAFTIDGIYDMKRMLEIVVGGEEELIKKPMAIFDVCPSSPLNWSEIVTQNLIDCAKFNLPIEIIPAPQLGATGPVTIAGSVAQHNAEFLSGLVMAQLVNPKTPVIYGGSPTVLDQRFATPSLGAIEAIMVVCCYTQIAKNYGIPTHAYLGISDSKIIDAQCGFESSIGIFLGVLAGVNVISGPGMLISENCQSLEKLVIDNEICGMALRLARGVKVDEDTLAIDLIKKVGPGGMYLAEKHTLKHFRSELLIPSEIIDRRDWKVWMDCGSKDTVKRAHEITSKILSKHKPEPLPIDVEKELDNFVKEILKKKC